MSNIEIVKVEFNEQGYLLYTKYSNGVEGWADHYENGNISHIRYSNGSEEWYDGNGNVTYATPPTCVMFNIS